MTATTEPPTPPANPSPLLAFALREASTLESDWLWYASRMLEEHERDYCLARAAWMNPLSGT